MGGSSNQFRGRRLVAVLGARALGLALGLALGAAGAATTASADDSVGNINPNASGSIIIHKHERQPGTASQSGSPNGTSTITTPVVMGVQFTAYQLTDVDLNKQSGWDSVKDIRTLGVPATACDSVPPTSLVNHPLVSAGDATTDEFGEATISPLVVGAYLVCETGSPSAVVDRAQPFLVTIPYPYNEKWLYNVHVYPKNGVTGIYKTVGVQADLGLGATATFPVTTKVPRLDDNENFTHYWVHDQMPSQITPAPVSSVTLGGTALAVDDEYKVTRSGNLVTVEFTQAGLRKLKTAAPADLVTTYRGVVASVSSDGTATDTAYVSAATKVLADAPTMPDSPTSPADSGYIGTASEPVSQNWGKLTLVKVDRGDATTGLTGAKFVVYAADTPYPTATCRSTVTSGDPIEIGGVGSLVNPFITGDGGEFTIEGLFVSDNNNNNPGYGETKRCYVLKEVAPPPGFILPINGAELTAVTVSTGVTNTASIPNTRHLGVVLPVTGSEGIVVLSVAGLALISAGIVLAFLARRKKQTA